MFDLMISRVELIISHNARLRGRSRFEPIIRRLFCNDHVVNMRFPETSRSDAAELCLFLELFDRAAAGIAHARAQTADKLRDHLGDRALVRDAALDAFRNILRVGDSAFLGITVARTFSHRADRAHSAIGLKVAALKKY